MGFTLAPGWTDDPTHALFRPNEEAELYSNEFWALTERAALDCRTKQPKEASLNAERSLAADGRIGRTVLNWLWLALIHQEIGSPKEARRWLDKAADWLDQQEGRMPSDTAVTGLHLHNWLEAHVLLQEAKARLR
jgi:hypothetical protein